MSIDSTSVLLIDDDADEHVLFSIALQKIAKTINFSYTLNARQGLQFIAQKPNPDIVFLDLNMHGMDGRECLRHIRSNPEFKRIPIVIYSTSNNEGEITETKNLGANAFLRKPETLPLMEKEIKAVMEHLLFGIEHDKHKYIRF